MPDMMVLKLLQCNYSRQLSDSYIHKTAVLFWKQAWEHMFGQEKYIQWQAEFIFTCKLGNLLVLKLWKTTLHIELRQHIKKPNECLSKHFTPFVLLLSWIWLYHKFIFRNKSHKAEPLFALICMVRSQPVLPWQDCTKLWWPLCSYLGKGTGQVLQSSHTYMVLIYCEWTLTDYYVIPTRSYGHQHSSFRAAKNEAVDYSHMGADI